MFPRRERFSREAFPTALRGRRCTSEHFSIIIPHNGKGYAVVVSKKIARLAVTRHKIKRRILTALRALQLPPALIVFPQTSINSVSYQDIKTELAQLLSKNIH